MLAYRPQPWDARRSAAAAQRARVFLGSYREEVVHPCGRNPGLVAPGSAEALAAARGLSVQDTTVFEKACAHLAWLARERARLRRERAEEVDRAAAKRAQLGAEAQLLRDVVRGVVPGEKGGAAEGDWAPARAPYEAGGEAPAPALARPGWARSAAAEEALEDVEAEGLVEFARTLDADAYLEELDLSAGVALADAQLRALDVEEVTAAAAVAAAAAAAAAPAKNKVAPPAAAFASPSSAGSGGGGDAAAAEAAAAPPPPLAPTPSPGDSVKLIASKALSEHATFRAVHSLRSLLRVVAGAVTGRP